MQLNQPDSTGPEDNRVSVEFVHEITRAQAPIAAYVRSLLPGHPDYMDVVQEVNVTLWRKQKKFEPGTNFKAWAFAVARYHVMAARRKMAAEGKRLVFAPELLELLAEAAPANSAQMEGRLGALHQCLGKLRDNDRDLLRVRYAGTGSIEDYARQHRRNAGTIRATLRRLRGVLLKCVKNQLRVDSPPAGADPAW